MMKRENNPVGTNSSSYRLPTWSRNELNVPTIQHPSVLTIPISPFFSLSSSVPYHSHSLLFRLLSHFALPLFDALPPPCADLSPATRPRGRATRPEAATGSNRSDPLLTSPRV